MAALSRAEKILQAKLNGESYDAPPQSRLEKLLLEIGTGGGGGGTDPQLRQDVNDLKTNVSALTVDVADASKNIRGISDRVSEVEGHAILDSSYGEEEDE